MTCKGPSPKLLGVRALAVLLSLSMVITGFLTPNWYYGETGTEKRYFGLLESCTELSTDDVPKCNLISYGGKAGSTVQVSTGFLATGVIIQLVDFVLLLYLSTDNWKERDCLRSMKYISCVLAILSGLPPLLAIFSYTANLADIRVAENLPSTLSIGPSTSLLLIILGGELNVICGMFACCCMCCITDQLERRALVTPEPGEKHEQE